MYCILIAGFAIPEILEPSAKSRSQYGGLPQPIKESTQLSIPVIERGDTLLTSDLSDHNLSDIEDEVEKLEESFPTTSLPKVGECDLFQLIS